MDPKLIREMPEVVRAAMAKKHLAADLDGTLALDAAWRALLQEVETLRAQQKAVNGEMARLPQGSPEFVAKVGEMKVFAGRVKEREVELKATEERWAAAMLELPNLPHASVPEGAHGG